MSGTILFFGSESVRGDNLAFKLFEKLKEKYKNLNMKKSNNAMDVIDYLGEKLIIIDAVKGIDDVTVFDDITAFKKIKSVSTHDMDLGSVLLMMDAANKVKKVRIIGIPIGSNVSDVILEVERKLSF